MHRGVCEAYLSPSDKAKEMGLGATLNYSVVEVAWWAEQWLPKL